MLPNRRPRLYHSGETSDLDFVVRRWRRGRGAAPLFAIGTSLGGNVLLKWLGEHPGQTELPPRRSLCRRRTTSRRARSSWTRRSAGSTSATFSRPFARRPWRRCGAFPEAAGKIDVGRTLTARTFWEFDDAANAPLHGFAGADDYYARASSIGYLPNVTTPTLCLSAEDDPFLPPRGAAPRAIPRSRLGRVSRHAARRTHRLHRRFAARAAGLLGRATAPSTGWPAARSEPFG